MLSGPISLELDDHSSAGVSAYTGTITIYEEKIYSSTPVVQSAEVRGDASASVKTRGDGSIDDNSDTSASGKEDSRDKSGTQNKDDGLWKRILKIFGVN